MIFQLILTDKYSLPTNLQFQVDDLEDEWTFSYNFDFIFARMMTGSIGDFPKFFTQSFNALSPGGWVECQDITFPAQCDDGTLKKDSYIDQWSSLMIEATNKFGRTAESAKFYKQQMIDAGFVNVTEVVYKWPTNRWPADPYYKELGMLFTAGGRVLLTIQAFGVIITSLVSCRVFLWCSSREGWGGVLKRLRCFWQRLGRI